MATTESKLVYVLVAEALGRRSARLYEDEFGARPTRETVGDWDSAAWSEDFGELRRLGMTEPDHDDCLDAWRFGFFGGERPARTARLG